MRGCTTCTLHLHNQRTFRRRQIAQLAVGKTERLYCTSVATAATRQIRPSPRAALTSQKHRPETLAVVSGDSWRRGSFRLQSITRETFYPSDNTTYCLPAGARAYCVLSFVITYYTVTLGYILPTASWAILY